MIPPDSDAYSRAQSYAGGRRDQDEVTEGDTKITGSMNGTMIGGMGVWMLVWPLVTLAALAAIVLTGVWLARRPTRDRDQATRRS